MHCNVRRAPNPVLIIKAPILFVPHYAAVKLQISIRDSRDTAENMHGSNFLHDILLHDALGPKPETLSGFNKVYRKDPTPKALLRPGVKVASQLAWTWHGFR